MHSDIWSKVIKAQRRQRHLTARQLAKLAGITPSYVSRMEREGAIPKRDKVIALAIALDCSVDALLAIAGYAPSSPVFELHSESDPPSLLPELSAMLEPISNLPKSKQRLITHLLDGALRAFADEKESPSSQKTGTDCQP